MQYKYRYSQDVEHNHSEIEKILVFSSYWQRYQMTDEQIASKHKELLVIWELGRDCHYEKIQAALCTLSPKAETWKKP